MPNYEEITFDDLQPGDKFKFSPESPSTFIYGYTERLTAYYTCLATGSIESMSRYTELEPTIVYR